MSPHRTNLYDLTREELGVVMARQGFAAVHAARLWNYLYLELADSFEAMPELPAKVRGWLAANAAMGTLPVVRDTASSDGFTRKFLLGLPDAREIETVLMRFTGRVTACVSSQVGCAMGCVFCATGQMGFTRHLTAGEIVAQAVHVARVLRMTAVRPVAGVADPGRGSIGAVSPSFSGLSEAGYSEGHPESQARNSKPKTQNSKLHQHDVSHGRLRNIVLMGMGEPLHNYDAVMRAVDILRDSSGLAIAAERITLSTVGVVPGILRLAQEKRPLHLAVSLHAATQPEREALVPVARKWPLGELMAACRTYSETTGRRIFYEWTLIEGENDTPAQARAVGQLLRGLPAQVNLIPLNPTAGYAGAPANRDAAKEFQRILAQEFGLPSTIRQRRGIDIAAGCGQLAVAQEG